MTTHYRWETALDQRRKKDPGIDTPERREAARTSREAFVLGYHLACMRKARGLTQQMVAESMGVSQVRVSRMENGELDRMQVDSISAYVTALGGQLELVADFDAPSKDEPLSLSAVSRAVIHATERLWAASGLPLWLQEQESLDRLWSRLITLQFESIALSLERRIRPLLRVPWADVEDITAAVREALAALEEANVTSDSMLYAIDDSDKLATLLHDALALPDARLDLTASRFYELLAKACSTLFADVIRGLVRFGSKTPVVDFGHLSMLAYEVETQLSWVHAGPANTTEGRDDHEDYTRRYLRATFTRCMEEFPALETTYVEPWLAVGDGQVTRLESLLRQEPRILMMGSAGSGKSTTAALLAHRLAQSSATSPAPGRVPFFVRLRDYATNGLPSPEKTLSDNAANVTAPPPPGWAQRQLDTGHATVVMDGLDEMAERHWPGMRKWLRGVFSRHPGNHVVITSRPHAVDSNWLREEGFVHVSIEPLVIDEQRRLIKSWHRAMSSTHVATDSPRTDELATRQRILLAQLEADPGLRELAGSPLMAITMARVNLTQDRLPSSRAALYKAAMRSLLQTRSAACPEMVGHATRVAQHLAWNLLLTDRADIKRHDAEGFVRGRLSAASPRPMQTDATRALDWLAHEGGILRESPPGTLTFTHQAFQSYLAAREAADLGEVRRLADNAHLDRWHEVIVLAAAGLNRPSQDELLLRLFKRADGEKQHSGIVKQTIVALMEVLPALSPEQKRMVDRHVPELVPPTDMRSALALAAGGPEVLDKLPDDLSEMTTTTAHFTVLTARLLGGHRAKHLLRRYAKDARPTVRDAAAEAMEPFSDGPSRSSAMATAHPRREAS